MARLRVGAIRAGVALGTVVVLLALALSFEGSRDVIARLALNVALSMHGRYLASGDLRVQTSQFVGTNIEIADPHGRVLSIERIVIEYDWRGLIGRGDRRFGIRSVDVWRPALRVFILPDGTNNLFAFPSAPAAAQPPGPISPTQPFDCGIRILDGRVDVENPTAYARPGRRFSLADVNADVELRRGRDEGTLHAHYNTGASTSPVRGRLSENDSLGFAEFSVAAPGVAIAPLLDAIVASPVFAVETGQADVHVRAFDVGYAAADGPSWRLSGQASLRAARIRFIPLVAPVRDAHGDLFLQAGYLGFNVLRGTASGLPVIASGSIRLFDGVRLALHANTSGDLHAARGLFAFTRTAPVTGPFRASVRVDGPLHRVHVAGAFNAAAVMRYGAVPLERAHGAFYYADNHLTFPHLDAGYDGGQLHGSGDIELLDPNPVLEVIGTASLPAANVPIAASLNAGGIVQARMLLAGPANSGQFAGFARTLGGAGASLRIAAGGRFGASAYSAAQVRWPSGDLLARTGYDHSDPSNRMLYASVIASHAPLRLQSSSVALPGIVGPVTIPQMSGDFNGTALVRGANDASGFLQTAITMRGSHVRIGNEALGDATLRAGGTGPRVAIQVLSVDGPDVQVRARGAARVDPGSLAYTVVLHGTGSLNMAALPGAAGMRPSGRVSGSFETAIASTGWSASMRTSGPDGALNGMPLSDAVVMAVGGGGKPTRYGIRAGALGGSVASVGTLGGGIDAVMWASGIDVRSLRAAGVPLDAGTAVVIGTVRPSSQGNTFDGAISLADGRYRSSPLRGDADVIYEAHTLDTNARLDVAGTRAAVRGSVQDVGPGVPLGVAGLHLTAAVRDGDAGVLGPYLPPSAPLTGTVNATMDVHGALDAPDITGTLDMGAATLRGVTFTDTRGAFAYHQSTLTLHGGQTQLGSTLLAFDGQYAPQRASVSASSRRLDLSDVNDFYRGYNAFQGTGDAAVSVSFAPHSARASGAIRLAGAEIAGIPLGAVTADFGGVRDSLDATVTQSGELGSSSVRGTVRFSDHASAMPNLRQATYDVVGRASGVDLGLVTRFAGLEDLDVRGKLDADGRLRGTLLRPFADATFSVRDGYVHKLALRAVSGSVTSNGGGISLTNALVDVPFGRATGNATLARSGRLSGGVQLAISDLGGIAALAGQPHALSGGADGTLAIAGTLDHPQYKAAVHAGKGSVYGVAFDDLSANASYVKNELNIGTTVLHLAKGAGTIGLTGSLPLQLRPFALGPASRRVDLELRAQKINLAAFDPLVKRFGTVDGTLDASASVTGVAREPDLAGSATLRNGAVTSPYQTTPLHGVSADLALSHDAVVLSALSGNAGKGSFSGSGAAHVVPAVGLRTTPGLSFYAKLHMKDMPLAVPNWVSGTLNGDISFTESGATPYLAGSVNLRNGLIPLPAIYDLATILGQTSGPPLTKNIPGVPTLLPGHTIAYGGGIYPPGQHLLTQADLATPRPTLFDLPSVNLGLTTGVQNVRVRGGPLDLTADGALAIDGSVRDPQLTGQFTAKRGQIAAFGITFRLQRGVLSFDPAQGVLPSLDAKAVTNAGGDQITLVVSGRIDHLNTDLSSNQGKSADEILGTIITGSPISTLAEGLSPQSLVSEAQRYFGNELTRGILSPFSTALAQSLNIEEVSLAFDEQGHLVIEVLKFVTPTVALLYRSTATAPVTQSYGAAYQVREFAALEFSSSVAPTGFVTYRLDMRVTFK